MSTSRTELADDQPAQGRLRESWLLLASFYSVIVGGALPLAVAEMTPAYLLLAAFLCGAHALLVGAGGRPLLSDQVCKLLSLGALLYALIESQAFDVHISYSLGHFLILVQLVLLYGPHRLRDMRLIPVVVLFELMVAGIWSTDVAFLPAFLLSTAALMANLVAIEMHADGAARRRPPILPVAESGLRKLDFLAAAWMPALIVLVVTALLFPVLPRLGYLGMHRHAQPTMVTGFTGNVSLRGVGLLRQSDRPALRAQFFRQDLPDHPAFVPAQLLMRGTSLPLYRRGQWLGYSDALRLSGLPLDKIGDALSDSYFASREIYELNNVDVPRTRILQKVRLESDSGRTLFALYRPLQLTSRATFDLLRGRTSNELIEPPYMPEDFGYAVVSMVPQFSPQMLRQANTPSPSPPWTAFWNVPRNLREVLGQVQQEVEAAYHPQTDYDRVLACMQYLDDPQRFTYTLDLPDYGDADPVAGFLVQTHRGSCEQFATALALMLRTWQVPTRLVVGYKDGQYDPVEKSYLFRDRDAHAWVEVYFTGLGWVQFDPTPRSDLPQRPPMAGSGLLLSLRRAVSDVLRYVNKHWSVHVIGYSRAQQRAFVEGVGTAAKGLGQEVTDALRSIWPGVPDLGFVQVALIVVGITFVGISLYLVGGWLEKAVRRRRRERPAVTVRFYRELLTILRRKGLRRPPHQTPREFAQVVVARLSPDDGEVGRAMALITDLYYRARFGGHEPDAAELSLVREALLKLKSTPRAHPAGRAPATA